MSQQFAVLGNPSNRRVRMFVRAVLEQGHPHPIVLSWLDLLAGRLDLKGSLPPGTLLRLESPGEHPMVDLLLLERAGVKLRLGDIAWGEIRHEKAWFTGWSDLLGELETQLSELELASVVNSPAAIRSMYDKTATYQLLSEAGIPQPPRLGQVHSFKHLLQLMDGTGRDRVFLKPYYSSSASGVIAMRRNGEQILGTTSVEMIEGDAGVQLFNSLNIATYRDRAPLEKMVDLLAKEDLLAEVWLPKASFQDATVDMRVVVIGGRARHVVLRSSQSPLTNLHLGNERGDLEAFRREVGEEKWREFMQLAEDAVAAIPRAGYAGVDLLVLTGMQEAAVAEVNAFGDLLPGVLHEGDTTYEAFVKEYGRK